VPIIDEILQTETSFNVESALTSLLGKRGSRTHSKSLVKPRQQGVHLVRVLDTPVILSHNEQTRDEHGNACVEHGLTSR
jgi:hypothetical protein